MLPKLEAEVDILTRICNVLSDGEAKNPAELLGDYRFNPSTIERKSVSPTMAVRVFVRDGFIDRYSGQRVIFPPVIRIVAERLGKEYFPFHTNWKTDCTHPAFWDLGATIDHRVPITRGGKEELDNYRTTTMTWNAVKTNCLLEELGWAEQPKGNVEKWDGLLGWFLQYVQKNPHTLNIAMIKGWYYAVFSASEEDELVDRAVNRTAGVIRQVYRKQVAAVDGKTSVLDESAD